MKILFSLKIVFGITNNNRRGALKHTLRNSNMEKTMEKRFKTNASLADDVEKHDGFKILNELQVKKYFNSELANFILTLSVNDYVTVGFESEDYSFFIRRIK